MQGRPPGEWLEPAATVVKKLGGPEKAAEIVGISVKSVYRWMWPMRPSSDTRKSRGTGGLIPAERQQQIMAWSRRNGYPVNIEDFFPHREDTRAA